MSTETTVLAQVSDGLAAAVEIAAASTVVVSARRRFPASGIVWSADGVIVTSDHVIEREEVEVFLPDGSKHSATIAGRDPGSDVAVLKIAATGLTPAVRAPQGSARVGSLVLAVGRPSTEGPMASLGVVGGIGGPWRTFRGTEVEGYLRSDTTFYPGFSGGPLVDAPSKRTQPGLVAAGRSVRPAGALHGGTLGCPPCSMDSPGRCRVHRGSCGTLAAHRPIRLWQCAPCARYSASGRAALVWRRISRRRVVERDRLSGRTFQYGRVFGLGRKRGSCY